MPKTSGTLLRGKPLVEVAVAKALPRPDAVSAVSQSPSFSVKHYRALLDTGADITCLCDHVAAECALEPYGLVMMTGSNGQNRHPSYIIHLGILCQEASDFEGQVETTTTLFQLPEPFEAAAIRDNQWFDIIIGTDIIVQHELTLQKGGSFVFSLS